MSVFFYGCVTLDGYLADKNHDLSWLYETGTVEETDYEQFYRRMDITLMGKRTFLELQKLEDPGSVYPTTINYVFTHDHSMLPKGFSPVDRDVTELVKELGEGKNIWVVGGNTLLSPLLDKDMVDHIILQIAPVLLGKGIPLFAQREAIKRFYLREVTRYGQFGELWYSKK